MTTRAGPIRFLAVARLGVLATILFVLAACTPMRQQGLIPEPGFDGPRFAATHFISFDGTRLGLSVWDSTTGPPQAVIIALHGMNDYARAFETAAPYWAARGLTTYAYDARGFGRSPRRGVWGGRDLMIKDMQAAMAAARLRHPGTPVVLVGESMGAATIMAGLGDAGQPAADRIVLIAPAVWGWSNLPLSYRVSLWTSAHLPVARTPFDPPRAVTRSIVASDNREMLYRLGRDPNMIFATRLDAVYGLVDLMEAAFRRADKLPPNTLVMYGAKDQIIPKAALMATAARWPTHVRSVFYRDGYHMLTRDLQAENVWADVAAFIRDPDQPLPSGQSSIPVTPK